MIATALAYFDESGTGKDQPYLCVAGYIFSREGMVQFETEWRAMLEKYGLLYFHMVECNQHTGIYKLLTEDQCIQAATDAIEIIKKYALWGIAIGFQKDQYYKLPKHEGLWDSPYPFVCNQMVHGVEEWALKSNFEGDVAYCYEAGATGWGVASAAMKKIRTESAQPREGLRFKHVTSAPKSNALALQAADILAWQLNKHLKRKLDGHKKRRGDFKSLMGVPTSFHVYDEANIDEWLEMLEALGL